MIYGNSILQESSTSYKLKGVVGEIKNDELSRLLIKVDFEILSKNMDSFMDNVAKEFFKYTQQVSSNFNIEPKFKSVKDVRRDIILKNWSYDVFVTSDRTLLRSFIPFIDFKHPIDEHIPSIEAKVTNSDIELVRISYDG